MSDQHSNRRRSQRIQSREVRPYDTRSAVRARGTSNNQAPPARQAPAARQAPPAKAPPSTQAPPPAQATPAGQASSTNQPSQRDEPQASESPAAALLKQLTGRAPPAQPRNNQNGPSNVAGSTGQGPPAKAPPPAQAAPAGRAPSTNRPIQRGESAQPQNVESPAAALLRQLTGRAPQAQPRNNQNQHTN